MAEKSNYFVLRAKAVPEVLLKVVEAKRLLDSGKLESSSLFASTLSSTSGTAFARKTK